MKLGVSGQALGDIKSLEEILVIMKKHNIKFIEIWPCNVEANGKQVEYYESRYEGRNIEKLKELTSKYGIEVACVTMPGAFEPISFDIEAYAAALEYAVETAFNLGAKLVNHYCFNLALNENPNIKHLMKCFEPAIKKAEELGVTLVLENEAHDAVRNPQGMLQIIKSVNSPYFKTNYDATNYYHASVEAFPYAYDVLKDYIKYVHIKSGCIFNENIHSIDSKGAEMSGANKGKYIYYPTIINGAVNIEGLLKRLEKDKYTGFCVLEPHTIPELVEAYYDQEIPYLRSEGHFQV